MVPGSVECSLRRTATRRRCITVSSYPPEYFRREDESDDREFYTMARLVVHIDDHAIAAVGQVFREFIPPDSAIPSSE